MGQITHFDRLHLPNWLNKSSAQAVSQLETMLLFVSVVVDPSPHVT
jgi:hypothetical protein